MHYYQWNIADYRKDTSHLSLLEHGIYRQLLDWYYLDEKPIETQQVIRRLSIKTQEEKLGFENVTNDFFDTSDCGNFLIHKRAELEIEAYKSRANTSRENGKKGGRPRNTGASGNPKANTKPKKTKRVILGTPDRTQSKPSKKATNNHKPITTNQEPEINKNNSLSGKPDPKPKSSKIDLDKSAREVIDHLNSVCGRNFQPVEANRKFIRARLSDPDAPADVETLKRVIDHKANEWRGTDQEKYLRPETLFNATKYAQYVGQLDLDLSKLSGVGDEHHGKRKLSTTEQANQIADEYIAKSGLPDLRDPEVFASFMRDQIPDDSAVDANGEFAGRCLE